MLVPATELGSCEQQHGDGSGILSLAHQRPQAMGKPRDVLPAKAQGIQILRIDSNRLISFNSRHQLSYRLLGCAQTSIASWWKPA
jgi:hypothetical protein